MLIPTNSPQLAIVALSSVLLLTGCDFSTDATYEAEYYFEDAIAIDFQRGDSLSDIEQQYSITFEHASLEPQHGISLTSERDTTQGRYTRFLDMTASMNFDDDARDANPHSRPRPIPTKYARIETDQPGGNGDQRLTSLAQDNALIEIHFEQDIRLVGIMTTTKIGHWYELPTFEAFDADGKSLYTKTIYDDNTFYGIRAGSTPIRSVTLGYGEQAFDAPSQIQFDDLRFEPTPTFVQRALQIALHELKDLYIVAVIILAMAVAVGLYSLARPED